ncbi:MAG: hypothetical protein NTW13_06410 [Candidatus Omnitrophica bacterium]|nr:hypothetical protein [Candidatus Omnitrophota bacterium]
MELLIRKLRSGIDTLISKGVDEQAILGNLIVTPSCGLGTFTPQKAEKIFQLLSETASFIQKNF